MVQYKQAVREAARNVPAPVRRTLRPSSSPSTPYPCGAQRALLPVALGAMNIHDVRDRRQTASSLNAPAYGAGHSVTAIAYMLTLPILPEFSHFLALILPFVS